MDRKATGRQTLGIMEQGYYRYEDRKVDISSDMEASVRNSFLITPQQADELLEMYSKCACITKMNVCVENISTVDAIRRLTVEGKEDIGVLNFASAKNPGHRMENSVKILPIPSFSNSSFHHAATSFRSLRKNKWHSLYTSSNFVPGFSGNILHGLSMFYAECLMLPDSPPAPPRH